MTELAILLEPLHAQIKSLQHWRECQRNTWPAKSQSTDGAFEDAIKMREVHLNSLTQLLERARELQAVVSHEPCIPTGQNYNLCIAISTQQYRNSKFTGRDSPRDAEGNESSGRHCQENRVSEQDYINIHCCNSDISPSFILHIILW